MQVEYFIDDDTPLDWKSCTLSKYISIFEPKGWEKLFKEAQDILDEISANLELYAKDQTIYPEMPYVFNSLEVLEPKDVKVVILGQDPYINKGESMGWSFSVPNNVKIPPSLKNMYKELSNEGYQGYKDRNTGDLTPWIQKGVFLYNACLTVKAGESFSHGALWCDFTNLVIKRLNKENNIAWILLGAKAIKYKNLIDSNKHGIFTCGHPSPLNKKVLFIGSNIFKEAEEYLNKSGKKFTWNL